MYNISELSTKAHIELIEIAKELGVSFYLIDTNKDERETIFKIAKEVLGIDKDDSKCSCCLII